jgi:hypothetical protein
MEDLGIGEKILKWALKEWGSWAWTKFMWLTVGASSRVL